ncbi:MAG TPA: Stp1/IreP family PP2C-type Ser/Thr phosphatase [Polyangiaceae bacterium]|nr:Stp1/IreP family PP2C-type Ser/Thr phosphatase [Polyangiaceae bacterium]
MSQSSQAIRLQLFGRTDVGQIREHNEDNFLVANLTNQVRGLKEENRSVVIRDSGFVLGVCDGMGGAAAGEVASQMAVDLIYEQLTGAGSPADHDALARRLVQAIEFAGASIFQEARSDRSRRGMGTTSTIAALLDRRLFVGQVGDSRAYLLRGGKLQLLTRDQSLVNQLIEAGQLTEEEAETFEHNNIILQALGTAETVQVDLTHVDLCKGDVLMLCSDGLSGMIRGDEIFDVLTRVTAPMEACRELTDRANAAGGHDNITVIVARVEEGPDVGPTDTFGYQKYTLPDVPQEEKPQQDLRVTESHGSHPARREHAEESAKPLRVSHTMLGVVNPMGDLETPREGQTVRAASHQATPERIRRVGQSDEPVDLPTQGLPPPIMATLVVSAMLLAALLGYLALR